jgi:hypothetical protein
MLPDFDSLQLLLRASPAVARLFGAYGLEIVVAIGDCSLHLDLPHFLNALLVIALYRDRIPHYAAADGDDPERSPPIAQFEREYLRTGAARLSKVEVLAFAAARGTAGTEKVDDGLALRRVVAKAANIERLVPVVLDELLSRLATVRPLQLKDPECTWGLWLDSNTYFPRRGCQNYRAWPWHRSRPPPTEAVPVDARAFSRRPSWIESYRVRRALWVTQVLVELRDHVPWIPPYIDPGWFLKDVDGGEGGGVQSEPVRADCEGGLGGGARLSVSYPLGGYNQFFHAGTVCECLERIGNLLDPLFPAVEQLVLTTPHPPPARIDAHVPRDIGVRFDVFTMPWLPRCPVRPVGRDDYPPVPTDVHSEAWGQTPRSAEFDLAHHRERVTTVASPARDSGVHFFTVMMAQMLMYRRLGLDIWDTERLYWLGLANHPLAGIMLLPIGAEGPVGPPGKGKTHKWYTWLSILLPRPWEQRRRGRAYNA